MNHKKRVLWVSSSVSKSHGGIVTFVQNMRDTELSTAWAIGHVATHRDGSAGVRVIYFARGFCAFIFELIIRRPRIVHLHTSYGGSFFRKGLLAWVSRMFRIPTIFHIHGSIFHEFYDNSRPSIKRVIRATLERADAVIALGEIWAARLREIAPNARVEVIPNAIQLQKPVDQALHDALRVVFLGKLCERKGTFSLLDAWAAVKKMSAIPPSQLILAGDGLVDRAREQAYELAINDSVEIRGWLDSAETSDLLARSHILVLPSLNEGQPMAILEAMSRGLCVVATNVGGVPELLGNSAGLLIDPGNTRALEEALAFALSDQSARSRMGAHAYSRAAGKFNVDAIAMQFDQLYRRIDASKR